MAASVTPAAPTPTTPAGITPGAGSPVTGATNPSAAFAALMGVMFGDQDSLAAQLLAGAKPGVKTESGQVPTTPGAEEPAEPGAQAQALAGAFGLAVPQILVDQAQTVATGEGQPATPGAAVQAAGDAPNAMAAAADATAAATSSGQAAAEPDAAAPKAATVPLPADVQGEAGTNTAQSTAAANAAIQAATAEAPPPIAPQPIVRATTNVEKTAAPAGTAVAEVDAPTEGAAAKPTIVASATADGAKPDGGELGAETKLATPEVTDAEAAPERKEASAQPAQTQATLQTAAAQAPGAATPVRGAPETVAHLAAQIAKHLEGRTTHFDIQLTPAGLGQVTVRVEISAHGQLTAAMGFDNPNAAAEVRGRAAELARALEQAGFDVSGGLSFDVAGDQGRAGQGMGQQQDDNAGAWRGRAFQAALDAAGETVEAAVTGALNLQRRSLAGVDIRI